MQSFFNARLSYFDIIYKCIFLHKKETRKVTNNISIRKTTDNQQQASFFDQMNHIRSVLCTQMVKKKNLICVHLQPTIFAWDEIHGKRFENEFREGE